MENQELYVIRGSTKDETEKFLYGFAMLLTLYLKERTAQREVKYK